MLSDLPEWKHVVKDRHVYLGNDALVVFDLFGDAESILKGLKESTLGLLLINPVYLEFMNVNDDKEKMRRSQIISDLNLEMFPITKKIFDGAINLQDRLPLKGCSSSPTDLYLGACVLNDIGDRCILTGNVKDFPMPIFKRLAHLVVEKDNAVRVLTFLTINKDI